MTKQAELDTLMDEVAQDFMNGLDGYSDAIEARVARIRSDVYDILDGYSKKDGRVSKARVNSLLRELDDVEYEIYQELTDELEEALMKAIEQAEKNTNGALIGMLGAALAVGSASKLNADEVVKNTLEFMLNRPASDGIVLADRLRSIAGLIRDDIQSALRYGVLRGETITKIGGRVRKSFADTAWQIKRIVKTELPKAFRKTILFIGGKLGIIKAVRIIDNRGRHRYHETHECYRLAEQDMYGWGKGVYRVEDTFILDPHPQCSAYFRYILDLEAIENAD